MILESRSLPGYVQEMSWELFEKRFVNVPVLSIFIVLTLSASGSEFDPFAVITNENEKKKWLLACGSLFPKVSQLLIQLCRPHCHGTRLSTALWML